MRETRSSTRRQTNRSSDGASQSVDSVPQPAATVPATPTPPSPEHHEEVPKSTHLPNNHVPFSHPPDTRCSKDEDAESSLLPAQTPATVRPTALISTQPLLPPFGGYGAMTPTTTPIKRDYGMIAEMATPTVAQQLQSHRESHTEVLPHLGGSMVDSRGNPVQIPFSNLRDLDLPAPSTSRHVIYALWCRLMIGSVWPPTGAVAGYCVSGALVPESSEGRFLFMLPYEKMGLGMHALVFPRGVEPRVAFNQTEDDIEILEFLLPNGKKTGFRRLSGHKLGVPRDIDHKDYALQFLRQVNLTITASLFRHF